MGAASPYLSDDKTREEVDPARLPEPARRAAA